MKKKVILERNKDGYSAAFTLRNTTIVGYGETTSKIKRSLQDGIESMIELSIGKQQEYWKSVELELCLDVPSIFREFDTLNVKAFAERLGMNRSLFQQYLSGAKCPGQKQSLRILRGINELGKEYLALRV